MKVPPWKFSRNTRGNILNVTCCATSCAEQMRVIMRKPGVQFHIFTYQYTQHKLPQRNRMCAIKSEWCPASKIVIVPFWNHTSAFDIISDCFILFVFWLCYMIDLILYENYLRIIYIPFLQTNMWPMKTIRCKTHASWQQSVSYNWLLVIALLDDWMKFI